jgi:DNA-directed RNA polymerase subunit RPC12/RpoP
MPSTRLLQNLKSRGIRLSLDEGDKIKIWGAKLSPELIERARIYKKALKLFVKRGSKVLLCYSCGKKTEFFPTLKAMSTTRLWECAECGWPLWLPEFNSFPNSTLVTILRMFKGSVVKIQQNERGR